MQLPFFYLSEYNAAQKTVELDEDTSRHVIQVLRMKTGSRINLTDGRGSILIARVVSEHKKKCIVEIEATEQQHAPEKKLIIGISLIKNSGRFEWFLEKATEIGVSGIVPLLCERTEKEKFRTERMQTILVSAMLQSRQCWLPVLHEPIAYELLFRQEEVINCSNKFIAHCNEGEKEPLLKHLGNSGANQSTNLVIPTQEGQLSNQSAIVLIGPEGDFTINETELAIATGFLPVSLGDTRLRTETAAIVAAALISNQ